MVASLLFALALGQEAPVPPKAAAPSNLQARFDAASEAAGAGRCRDAVSQFEAIEASGAAKRNPLVAAAIAVRKGGCLIGTARSTEGEAAIRQGLPVLEAKGDAFAGDVRDARLTLATAAILRFDYDAAERQAEAALALSKEAARVRPLMLLARIRMFDRDGRALALADEARTITMSSPSFTKKDVAVAQTLYARVLMNEGRKKEAYDALKDSLRKQGGLTLKVSLADIGTRSDLAIAALQNGDRDAAREYLAYTGAGRMKDSPFTTGAGMESPACGEATGLKPQDVAIVEFTLEDDGHVSSVSPIYTPGDRNVALAFARVVAGWSWKAEDAAKIPLLFRYATRVEMRCAKAGDRPAITAPLQEAFEGWLRSAGAPVPAWKDMPDARALPLQRAALTGAPGDRPALLQAAVAVAQNPVAPGSEREIAAKKAGAAAQTLDMPAPARTYVALALADIRDGRDSTRNYYRSLLADPKTAADPLSAATLRLLIAAPGYRERAPADAKALLDAVIDAPDLPARHPLKVNAMLQEANVLAAKGDLPGARAVFDRTGLSEEQCAMIGLTPSMRRSGAGSNDYPMEAVRMGFEGWVRTEFDVAADGATVAPRAVIAYPPFVFDDAATGIIRDSRYTSSFRPSGSLACSGNQQNIVFRLPGA